MCSTSICPHKRGHLVSPWLHHFNEILKNSSEKPTCKLIRILFSSSSALLSCFISCLFRTNQARKRRQSFHRDGKREHSELMWQRWSSLPVLALQQLYRGPQVSELVLQFLQRHRGQRWVAQLGGGAYARGGRRRGGAMAGSGRDQDGGLVERRSAVGSLRTRSQRSGALRLSYFFIVTLSIIIPFSNYSRLL